MKTTFNELHCHLAFGTILHSLDIPAIYGLGGYAELFGTIVGDTPFDGLPDNLRADIGSPAELKTLATALHDAWSNVAYVLRNVAYRDDVNNIIYFIRQGGLA